MHAFTDRDGHRWNLAVTVDTLKRVPGLCDVDLLQIVEGDLLERLVADPVLLCDVVYACCKGEADERETTDEDFGRAMAGEAIDAATEALLEELVDFFPRRRRELLRAVLDRMQAVEDKALNLARQRIADPGWEAEIERRLANAGNSSGAAPASADAPRDR